MKKENDFKLPKFWIGYIIGIIFILVEIIELFINPSLANERISGWSVVLGMGGLIYWWVCVYKFHKVLNRLDPSYPITPGKAVGYNFIPFYNIYWVLNGQQK